MAGGGGGGGGQSAIAAEDEDLERGAERDEEEEESQYFTDAEDHQSWASHSRHNSTAYEDYISTCASVRASSYDGGDGDEEDASDGEHHHRRKSSCVSECSLDDVDLEAGLAEIIKDSPEKAERCCRICHLGLETAAAESGAGITLGCSCKGDLSYSHKQCAETWFKIRGNNSTACNVVGVGDSESVEQWNESNSTAPAQAPPAETHRFWQGHRFLNFLLACMVFAFVISWLFHFNVPG